ncbi:MATE family efflux transporter [Fusibacter sp. 3D3]|uniref:MATE family efflux transporter n=1 Tax=Fusibacter sp. 3D3 TaxID=1048380 RepID=UPI00085393B3|nr:MATE family efflux transporter [Fusibacter sp. 3D3]GAU76022.1 multi antimicrobial extrusion protein Na(+)/drug antiporter [Fusibacter sp. 3D3]
MNEKNKKIELLGNVPIPKALLTLGLPAMIGMMINALYNLVDAYFVGGLGTSQMGAISVTFPLGQLVVGLGLLFGNGAASYISRLLGRHEQEKAGQVASTAVYSSIIVGTIAIIGIMIFLYPILKLLGATESIMPYAITYASINLIFSIFNVFNVTMNNIVTSEGAAKTTMITMLAGALLNMILDPIFIYTLNMGVAGAAIATALSQIFSSLIYVFYILSQKSIFNFRIKACCFSREIMSEILKIGVPTLIFQLLTSLAITLTNMASSNYGDSVIAGMGAVTRIISLGSLIVFGFLKGFQPLAGYNYAAKNYARLHEVIKTALLWTTLFCVCLGLTLILFPTPIISQFTKGDAVLIDIGQKALRANGLSFMLFGFYTVYSSLFLSLGKAKEGLLLGICRQGICFIPMILTLPMVWGINGILYAQPIADAITTIITAFVSIRLYKTLSFKVVSDCEESA